MVAGPEPYAGRVLAGYRLLHTLGAGGASVVYLAQRTDEPAALAAIKILRPAPSIEASTAAAIEARFMREAEAARRLSNPHILPVLDYGRDEGLNYMVLPFMPGGTLTTRIHAFAHGMPLPLAADYLNQIASALDYAHERGVIHRDIKPANILLDADGNLMLADFGIARVFERNGLAAMATLTADGQLLGTPAYMAPEQLDGPRVSPQADIYALGVTLYQMVTGALPFEADTPIALAMKRLHTEPPPPRRDRADLPAPAQAAILRAMARRPEDRYQTAGALARAFDAGIRGQMTPQESLPQYAPSTSDGAETPTGTASTVAATPQPGHALPLTPMSAGLWPAPRPSRGADQADAPRWTPRSAPTVPSAPVTSRGRGAPALWVLLGVLLTLIAVVAGAVYNGWTPLGLLNGSSGQGAHSSPRATQTAKPSASDAACLALQGFSGASNPATGGSTFADTPFPTGAVSAIYQTFQDGGYHFTLLNACAPSTSIANVRAFYAQAMPVNGWTPSSTYPYGGQATRACGDPYCWVKGSSPPRYVSLESVGASGAEVTYQLRLGVLQ